MKEVRLSAAVADLARWMEEQTCTHRFADISAIIHINNGKISLIERTTAEKVKPPTGAPGGTHGERT